METAQLADGLITSFFPESLPLGSQTCLQLVQKWNGAPRAGEASSLLGHPMRPCLASVVPTRSLCLPEPHALLAMLLPGRPLVLHSCSISNTKRLRSESLLETSNPLLFSWNMTGRRGRASGIVASVHFSIKTSTEGPSFSCSSQFSM